MSFSTQVKKELCGGISGTQKRLACYLAMCIFSANGSEITLSTGNSDVSELFLSLCGEYAAVAPEKSTRPYKGGMLDRITISADNALSGRKFSSVSEDLIRLGYPGFFEDYDIDTGAFIAGAFLAGGSITDPEKEYHLEITCTDSKTAAQLSAILASFDISSGTAQRSKKSFVYIKGSEGIEDLLTLVGAPSLSVELMNVKIFKDVRNKANRLANCDNANIDRILRASQKQIEDIQYILDTEGLEVLPPDLYDMAVIRLENPDVSLSELGTMLLRPVGRSGVNHRLRRLTEIAQEMREKHSKEKTG